MVDCLEGLFDRRELVVDIRVLKVDWMGIMVGLRMGYE